jgi:hypothetical protein
LSSLSNFRLPFIVSEKERIDGAGEFAGVTFWQRGLGRTEKSAGAEDALEKRKGAGRSPPPLEEGLKSG